MNDLLGLSISNRNCIYDCIFSPYFLKEPVMDTDCPFDMDLNRCLCLHATYQAIDCIVQSLLFERGIIPRIVPELLAERSPIVDDEEFAQKLSDSQRFTIRFNKLRRALREIFRKFNRSKIAEVVLSIGPSTYSPRELYRIPVHLRLCRQSQDDHFCSLLSEKEMRKISSLFILNPPSDSFRKLPKSARTLFILIRADDDAQMHDDFREDDAFVLPDSKSAKKRNIDMLSIRLKHDYDCPLSNDYDNQINNAPESSNEVWFTLSTPLKGFDD